MEKRQWKSKKLMTVSFFDRQGTFQFAVPNGDKIPKGWIIGKGWTVKVQYFESEFCQTCQTWLGLTDEGIVDCNCS